MPSEITIEKDTEENTVSIYFNEEKLVTMTLAEWSHAIANPRIVPQPAEQIDEEEPIIA